MMNKIKTRAYDASAYLKDDGDCALYLKTVIKDAEGDEKVILAALGDVARAKECCFGSSCDIDEDTAITMARARHRA